MRKKKKNQKEVIKEADKDEILVLRKPLSSQHNEKEEQTENIFHSRRAVQGKVSSLIIDGGSCANVLSLSMIENLNLHASADPHPNNIQWLN